MKTFIKGATSNSKDAIFRKIVRTHNQSRKSVIVRLPQEIKTTLQINPWYVNPGPDPNEAVTEAEEEPGQKKTIMKPRKPRARKTFKKKGTQKNWIFS